MIKNKNRSVMIKWFRKIWKRFKHWLVCSGEVIPCSVGILGTQIMENSFMCDTCGYEEK